MNLNNNKVSSDSSTSGVFSLSSSTRSPIVPRQSQDSTTESQEKTTRNQTTIPSEISSKTKDKNVHSDSSESWPLTSTKKRSALTSTSNNNGKHINSDLSDSSSSLSSDDLFNLESMTSSREKSRVSKSGPMKKQTKKERENIDIPVKTFYVKDHNEACTHVNRTNKGISKYKNKGPFYFPRKYNQKYPAITGVSATSEGLMFFKNNFTGNQELLKAFRDTKKREETFAQHVEKLFVSFDNVYEYDDDTNQLKQVHPRRAKNRLLNTVARCFSQKKTQLGLETQELKYDKKLGESTKIKTEVGSIKQVDLQDSIVSVEGFSHAVDPTLMQDLLYKDLTSTSSKNTRLTKLMGIEETCFKKATFEVDIETYPKYSMIHSLIEPFTFNVYHGSHLGHNQIVHRSSMLQLKIDDEMFVLFHGNLIHGGAQSKKERRWSFNYGQDVRLFAYIDKMFKVRGGSITYRQHSDNAGCSPSFSECAGFSTSSTGICECTFCAKMYKEVVRKYPVSGKNIVVDCFEMYKIKRRTSAYSKSDEPILIVGDLDKFGWAVYKSQFSSLKKEHTKQNLYNEVNHLMYFNSKNIWRDIQKGRFVYEITVEKNIERLSQVRHMRQYFADILEYSLKKIPGFENSVYGNYSIIRNSGFVPEQSVHRDYEPYFEEGNRFSGGNTRKRKSNREIN